MESKYKQPSYMSRIVTVGSTGWKRKNLHDFYGLGKQFKLGQVSGERLEVHVLERIWERHFV